jgi:hypothetical protein
MVLERRPVNLEDNSVTGKHTQELRVPVKVLVAVWVKSMAGHSKETDQEHGGDIEIENWEFGCKSLADSPYQHNNFEDDCCPPNYVF